LKRNQLKHQWHLKKDYMYYVHKERQGGAGY